MSNLLDLVEPGGDKPPGQARRPISHLLQAEVYLGLDRFRGFHWLLAWQLSSARVAPLWHVAFPIASSLFGASGR